MSADYDAGAKVIVWYTDDDVWHERIVLAPGLVAGTWWVLTPDGDVYEESLLGKAKDGPDKVRHVPFGVRTLANLRRGVYRFKKPLDDAELKGHVRQAHEAHRSAHGRLPGDGTGQVLLADGSLVGLEGWLQPRFRVTAKGPRRAAVQHGPIPAGSRWRVADPRGSFTLGMEVRALQGDDLRLSDTDGVIVREGRWLRVEVVEDDAFDEWLSRRQLELGVSEAVSIDKALGVGSLDEPETQITEEKVKPSEVDDARTLWVEYDSQGERYRDWRRVVQDSSSSIFSDWPHQGPQSTLHMLKHCLKHGGEPRSWMQLWMKKHNVAEHDRTAHELRALIEIIYLGGSYDQLNLPSLASFEAASRRVQTIVEAFASGSAAGPEWGHARLFTGSFSPDDLVSPELRAWAAKRGKEGTADCKTENEGRSSGPTAARW